MNQYLKQYQKTHVETASQEKVLIMLFEGAIQFLNKAKIALSQEDTDYEALQNNLTGAQNIINEFINTIDPEPAPEIAENLIKLYRYMLEKLVEANIKRDTALIDEVLELLRHLKGTWEEAAAIAKAEKPSVAQEEDSEE